jgi:hypothetical protein
MVSLLILLVIVGVVLYLVETYVPMSAPIKVRAARDRRADPLPLPAARLRHLRRAGAGSAMNRRTMFAGLGALVGAGATVAARESMPADVHVYRGHEIRWREFQTPTNQLVLVGCWYASPCDADPNDRDRFITVSTTLGVVDTTRPMYTLNTTLEKGWPVLMAGASRAERDAVKRRALEALYEALR